MVSEFNNGQYEVVTDNSDVDVKIYLSEEIAGVVPPHWHRHIEIVLVLDGEVTFNYEGQVKVLHNNEFIVIGSEIVHASKNSKNRSIVLQVPIFFLERYWDTPELLRFHVCQVETKYELIVRDLKILLDIYRKKDVGYRLKFNEILMKCLYNILKNCSQVRLQVNTSEDLKLKELLMYVDKEYKSKLSVHGLAEKFHFHPDYLSRSFKKKTNLTLNRYIYLIRLSHVYYDISTTDRRINAIFLDNGITNIRLATKLFEECYGVLPNQIRK